MNNTYKNNKTDWRRLGRGILLAALLLGGGMTARATDYVIAYTNNGTTYYLGMNGTNLEAKTTFDLTCVWQGYYNADYSLGTTRINIRNKNNTSYYLYYNNGTLTASTTSQRRWYGADGSSIYYYNNPTYGYIHNSGSSITTNNSSTDAFIPYSLTTSSVAQSTTRTISVPTITYSEALALQNGASVSLTANATVTQKTIPAHTKYTFGTTTLYYYNSTFYTSTDDFVGNPTNPTPTYTWTKTGDDGSNASLSSTNTANTTVTHSTGVSIDKAITLNVTTSYTGAESQSASVTVYLLTTNPTAPVISRYGNSQAQITCEAIGATIYYTTDGSTPTSSSTEYTGPFDLNCPSTTVKAIAVRNGHSSTTASLALTCKLPTPVITLTGANATIAAGAGSPDGTKLYYTTDGTTPTSSSDEYTGGNITLTNTQTIKVIAIKSGYDNSEVAMAEYIVEGVSGGLVVLDDREDHTWTYYSDAACPVHRLNPADIKITYYGYGTKTMTSSNTDQLPANDKFTENVANTAVKVNQNEAGHTFIYYKTLENANDDGTGNYPYTMIPNPFQVRPTYNSDWRGFYAWRVKSLSSGLSIKVGNTTYTSSNISNGIIIYAEQEVEFITANEYGDSVAFEALWAKAYLDDGTNYYSNSGNYRNAYERNFKKVTSLTTYDYPVTISSINPDGSGTVGSVTRNSNYTCSNDVKLENMTLNMSSYYIDGNSYNLAIGRGVANGNNNVASAVYGDSSPNSVRGDFTLRIESGKYSSAYLFYYSSGTGNNDNFTANAIYGSDYDRANNEDNTKLDISGVAQVGRNVYCSNANSIIDVHVLSGKFGSNTEDVELYMGFAGTVTGNSFATRYLEVLGGECRGGIAGGIEKGVDAATTIVNMRIKGGIVHRYLYGSGQYSAGYGSRRIVITGGTFDSWVAGGCFGTGNTDQRPGTTNGNIYLYFGGDANQTNTDGIFGAGYGNYDYSSGRYNVIKSNVVFADEATTAGSVYGGGNNGYATDDIKVYLTGGHVTGNVFGGANKAPSSQDVAVVVTGGSVDGGVYGGSNQSGAISGQITVDVYGTDPQPGSGYAIHQVFGGGNVAAYTGTPVVTVHNDSSCNISIGEVYGGGNAATVTGTNVTVSGGNRIGNVFGGCYGANVTTNGTKVTIKGGTIEKVFGGNNAGGGITGAIKVRVNKDSDCPMKIGELYGGGNVAGSAAGSIDIGCTGTYVDGDGGHADCNETTNRIGYELEGIGDVFGGANEANISTGITLTIDSGMVYRVFGGNNSDGDISGTITVNIQKTNPNNCGWYVGYVYGGGFNADYSNAATNNPAVNVSAGLVSHNVYGGGKGYGAVVTGNPTVTLSGTATVGGNVYGGGDAAAVTGNTSVKLQN